MHRNPMAQLANSVLALTDEWPVWVRKIAVPPILGCMGSYLSLLVYITTINMWWSYLSNVKDLSITALVFTTPAWIAIFTKAKPAAVVTWSLYAIAGVVIYGFDLLSLWGLTLQLTGLGLVLYFTVVLEERITNRGQLPLIHR